MAVAVVKIYFMMEDKFKKCASLSLYNFNTCSQPCQLAVPIGIENCVSACISIRSLDYTVFRIKI